MLNFINEITEARLFKYAEKFDDRKITDLAKTYYMMMLALHILRYEDAKWAKDYANKTLQFNEFTGLRTSASDMHNLIVAITNQGDYEFKGGSDANITIPLLGLKRYMRDIVNNRKEQHLLDNHLFLDLESSLQLQDSQLRAFRRVVMFWHTSSDQHKKTMIQSLAHKLFALAATSDITVQFKKVFRV